jgi:hypothetical protein
VATRLYFDTDAAVVSPAFDGAWEATGSAVRRGLSTGKLADHAFETLAVATNLNSPAGAVDALILQAVSAPLAGNVTIAGAIAGQIRAMESSATGDLRMQCVIWVMQSDGSSRGTLIAASAAALASEWPITTPANRKIPLGGSATPTSVAAQAGDRIVVEIGYRKHESATTSRTGTIVAGNPSGTDLAVDETTTTANVAWIEFTESLTFSDAPTRVSDLVVQAGVVPPDPATRVSDLVVQAGVTPPDPAATVSGLVLQTAILIADAVPRDAGANVSGVVLQAGIAPSDVPTRISDLVVQTAILVSDAVPMDAGTNVSGLVVQAAVQPTATARVSGAVIQVAILAADAVVSGGARSWGYILG